LTSSPVSTKSPVDILRVGLRAEWLGENLPIQLLSASICGEEASADADQRRDCHSH
jgi:hypothetical protein